MPRQSVRRLHQNRGKPPRKMEMRLVLVALVLVAVLIILLRLAEYPAHREHHPRPNMEPAGLVP